MFINKNPFRQYKDIKFNKNKLIIIIVNLGT